MKELKVWLRYTNNSFQQVLASRGTMLLFVFGKLSRIVLFLGFLFFLFRGTKGIGSYNSEQIVFFYLSFNLIDSLGQLLFREVYRFRSMIAEGGLDLVLVKPLNPLVRVLLGGADIMDLVMTCLLLVACLWFGTVHLHIAALSWVYYFILVFGGLIISTAFYILVLSLAVVTITVDHLVMIYRDITSLLRIPVDLYSEPLRFTLTFLLPVAVMLTFPVKMVLGLLSWPLFFVSLLISVTSLFCSLRVWDWAIKKYSSASS